MQAIFKPVLLGWLIFLSIHASAAPVVKCTLSGKVTDSKQQPLPGAVVELPDLHTGIVADINGNYKLTNLPSGNYLVAVKLLGFASQTRQLHIEANSQADFTLTEAVLEQHEVIVTGTSHATDQRKSPTPIQSISLKQLQENASSNIISAISRMPGVSQLSTGPAISKPVIRGLGYNRIITLNDGIRQEGQQWGDEHGIEIDDYNVARVEVLKGPASLAYGSDAIAGVINILSAEPMPIGKIAGKVSANYQTNNGLAALNAQIAGNENGLSWQAYVTGKKAHDYKNAYDGAVYNTRFSNTDYGASIGINKHWGSSRLSFTSFNQDLGIAEGERDSATGQFIKPVNDNGTVSDAIVTKADGTDYSKSLPRQHIVHQKLAWVNNLYLRNGGHIGLTLGYQQNNRQEFGDVLQPEEPGLSLQLKTVNYDLHYLLPTKNGWQVSTGINGMQQHNENKGIEFLVPDYQLFDIGAYVIGRKEIGKWSIAGGLRVDTRQLQTADLFVDSLGERTSDAVPNGDTRFPAFKRSFTSPSGSLGVSYAANKQLTWKANFSSGYRAPNIAELSANGVHEGTIRYEYGDKDLKAEHSYQGDLGMEYSSKHFLVNAAVFYNSVQNFIFTQKLKDASGNDSIPTINNDEGFPAYNYTQVNAHLFGGELYIDFHPHPLDWLHLENTFSYVQGRTNMQTDSTKYLPNIPPARWLIALRAQQPSIGKFIRNAYFKVELDNYLAQNNIYSAYETETASPGYSLLNASLGFDIVHRKTTLCTLTLAAENITDKAYQNHLSRLRYGPVNYTTDRSGIYNVGRNFSLMLTVPLQFK